jgi:hypothetical protein
VRTLASAGIFLILCVLCTTSAAALGPVLDESSWTEPGLHRTLQFVADEVWAVIQEMFHGEAPPLPLPIVVNYGGPMPLTSLDNEGVPRKIFVRITTPGSQYDQFAYQMGHELGHVMLNPRRTTAVIETLCTTISYEVLDRLSDRWNGPHQPLVYLRSYTPQFHNYAAADLQIHLATLPASIRTAVAGQDWTGVRAFLKIQQRVEDGFENRGEGQPGNRDIQALESIVLRTQPIPWENYVGFAACGERAIHEFTVKLLPVRCFDDLHAELYRIGRGGSPAQELNQEARKETVGSAQR